MQRVIATVYKLATCYHCASPFISFSHAPRTQLPDSRFPDRHLRSGNRFTGAAGYAYTYDADGNRAIKSNGSTGTLYWYMTPGIVGESDLSGNLTDEYVFFDGERVARKSTNGVFYYFSDHLKTSSVITDSAGVIKAESDYYPWGGELQFVANDSNHYKFTEQRTRW
jgi:uncharacterized protein RhaS with RHS repeats